MNLTTSQLAEMGYVEILPGKWQKGGGMVYTQKPPQEHGMAPTTHFDVPGATKTPPKRIRQSQRPLMNKLELEWYGIAKLRFTIVIPQGIRFMLANGIWYKPDFVCWPMGSDSQDPRIRVFEVKGKFAHRGGFENLKVAANKYRHMWWILVWKEAGQWKEQTVLP